MCWVMRWGLVVVYPFTYPLAGSRNIIGEMDHMDARSDIVRWIDEQYSDGRYNVI